MQKDKTEHHALTHSSVIVPVEQLECWNLSEACTQTASTEDWSWRLHHSIAATHSNKDVLSKPSGENGKYGSESGALDLYIKGFVIAMIAELI